MKYDTMLAEWLYGGDSDTPDDQVGSSSEGAGWAGRWDDMGVILVEATDGSVTTIICKDDADRMMKWADIEHELEPSNHPDDEDYVIGPKLYVVPMMQTFETLEIALHSISDDMKRNNFYPDVWLQDDHGGFTNVSEDVPDRT